MRNLKTFLANLSHLPGVYQMLDKAGTIIYVGKAKDLKKRVSSYFSGRKDPKTTSLVKQVDDIEITITQSDNEAVLLECNLIKKYRPRYNILLRDDKSFPYIIITNQHAFPRIDLYRGQRKKNALYFGPFPNSLAARETIDLLQKLFRIRTCADSFFSSRSRPCLLYQINRCTGPCVGLISKEDYHRNVTLARLFLEGKSDELIHVLQQKMETASLSLDYELAAEYRDQIHRVRQIQERQYVDVKDGDADVIGIALQSSITCIHVLSIRHGQVLGSSSYYPTVPMHSKETDILSAFITQHYLTQQSHLESMPKEIILDRRLPDQALLSSVLSVEAKRKTMISYPLRGERIKWLRMATQNAKQSLSLKLFAHMNMQERLTALQVVLGLQAIPNRVECFDVSHAMGEATVASCVVFDVNGPIKSDYRRYNITGVTAGDDVAAMQQALTRRFERLQKDAAVIPDIIFIDGGKAQLNAAAAAMLQTTIVGITLVGVSKGPGRKAGLESIHVMNRPPMHLPADSPALHCIQQVRDEAHRFAITGHRKQRDKARRHSSLEDIPGIGAKRRRDLLRYFGGIQGIAHASLDELMKVPGINQSIAERIFATLHDTII